MRICLLGYAAVLPANGGANYARNLAEGLARRGHEVEIVTQPVGDTGDTAYWRFTPVAGGKLRPLGGPRFSLSVLAHFLSGRRGSPRIIHSFSAYPSLALLAAAASRVAGAGHVHSALAETPHDWSLRLAQLLVYSHNGRRPQHPNAVQIPPPIPLEPFRAALAARTVSRPLRLGFMGPPLPRKGLRPFVESLPAIVSACQDVEVSLAIDVSQGRIFPEQQAEVLWARRFVAEHGLRRQVRICGEVNPATFLGGLDLLVYPMQTAIGLLDPPLTVIEAMASGCAVLGTRVGGIPTLLADGDAGFLIDAGREHDPDAYAEAVRQLAGDRARLARAAARAAEIAGDFCRDRVAGLFEEQYARLA